MDRPVVANSGGTPEDGGGVKRQLKMVACNDRREASDALLNSKFVLESLRPSPPFPKLSIAADDAVAKLGDLSNKLRPLHFVAIGNVDAGMAPDNDVTLGSFCRRNRKSQNNFRPFFASRED